MKDGVTIPGTPPENYLEFMVNATMIACIQTMGLDDYDSEAVVSMHDELHDRVMRYAPSGCDMGLDPAIMTRDQAREFDETGRVPEGVDRPDSIRSGSPLDFVIDDPEERYRQDLARNVND